MSLAGSNPVARPLFQTRVTQLQHAADGAAPMNRRGYFTYYVIVDPIARDDLAGETMRDMVRQAFPGEDGQERVRLWMSSIVLGELRPEGEQFVEADLNAENPPE